MSRYLTQILATITSAMGTFARGIVVTGLATHGLRPFARTLLVRLTGEALACWQAASLRHRQPAVAYAARTFEPAGSNRTRPRASRRLVKPRSGAGPAGF